MRVRVRVGVSRVADGVRLRVRVRVRIRVRARALLHVAHLVARGIHHLLVIVHLGDPAVEAQLHRRDGHAPAQGGARG